MPIDPPPAPPVTIEQSSHPGGAPVADMRDSFARKSPQTAADRAAARAFIEGKIDMIRRDKHMTDDQKSAAIADLEARRDETGR